MTTWLIVKSAAIAPSSKSADAAYRVALSRDEASREVVVEFTAPSTLTCIGYAEEVTRRFLPDREPPRHLVVDVGGSVRVLQGPLETTIDTPRETVSVGPQRARARRRS
jgi:hypothetical protein